MTATRAATDTCGSGVDPWPSELGEPADLDLLRASLQHLAACYRDLADNNLLATSEVPARTPACGGGVARITVGARRGGAGRRDGTGTASPVR